MVHFVDVLVRRFRRWLHGPSFRDLLSEELHEGHTVRLRVSTFERSLEHPNRPARVEGPAVHRIQGFHRG